MKFCVSCGEEILDDAVVCVKCGCSQEVYTYNNINHCYKCGKSVENTDVNFDVCPSCGVNISPKVNSGLKVAKIFMLIRVFDSILSALISIILISATNDLTGLIYFFGSVISLCWICPMTTHVDRQAKYGGEISTGFKVCVLFFVSLIAGIILLCVRTDGVKNSGYYIVQQTNSNVKTEEKLLQQEDYDEENEEEYDSEDEEDDEQDSIDDLKQKLEKLKTMKESGILTKEEYAKLKAKVLEEF